MCCCSHKFLMLIVFISVVWMFSTGLGKPEKSTKKNKAAPGSNSKLQGSAGGKLVGPAERKKFPAQSAKNEPNKKQSLSGKIPGPNRLGRLAGPKKGGIGIQALSSGKNSGGRKQFNIPGIAGKKSGNIPKPINKPKPGAQQGPGMAGKKSSNIPKPINKPKPGAQQGPGMAGKKSGNIPKPIIKPKFGAQQGQTGMDATGFAIGGSKTTNEVDNFTFKPRVTKNDGIKPDSMSGKIFDNLPPSVPQLSDNLKKKLTPEQLARIIDAIKAGLSNAILAILQAALSPIFDPDKLANMDFKDLPEDLQKGLLSALKKFLSALEKHLQKMISLMEPQIQKLINSYLSKGKTSDKDLDELGAKIAIALTTDAPFMEILTSVAIANMFPESDLLNELTSPDFVTHFSKLGPVGDIKSFLDQSASKALLDALNKLLCAISAIHGTKLKTDAKSLPHIKAIMETLLFSKIPVELQQNGLLRLPLKQISPYLSSNSLKIPDATFEYARDKPAPFVIDKLPQNSAFLPILLNYLALNKKACSKDTLQHLELLLPELKDPIQKSQKTPDKPMKSAQSFKEMSSDLFKDLPMSNIKSNDVLKRMKKRLVTIKIRIIINVDEGEDDPEALVKKAGEQVSQLFGEDEKENKDANEASKGQQGGTMLKNDAQGSDLPEGSQKVEQPSAGQEGGNAGYLKPDDGQTMDSPPPIGQQAGTVQKDDGQGFNLPEGGDPSLEKPSAGQESNKVGYSKPDDDQTIDSPVSKGQQAETVQKDDAQASDIPGGVQKAEEPPTGQNAGSAGYATLND